MNNRSARANRGKGSPSGPAPSAAMLVVLVLAGLVWVVFGQCVTFDFVNYDDNPFVLRNSHVLKGLTCENVRWLLTAGIGRHVEDIDYWRPLSMASHMLDVSLFGLNAGAHHAVNIGLHALAAVALFLVMRSLTGALWCSACVAAVFAVHPLHVESVAWIAERKDVLSGLFFFLALGAYARFTRRPFHVGNYVLVVVLFALGLTSKPMLVTLPCVLLLLDYWPLNRVATVSWRRLMVEKIPLFAMAGVVGVLAAQGPGGSNREMMAAVPLPSRVANAIAAYAIYLRQMIWPEGLACFYPHPGQNLPVRDVAAAAGVLSVITIVCVLQRRRAYLPVGWLWFGVMLIPVIGLVQSGDQAHADRYIYLPLTGVSVMVAWTAAAWAGGHMVRRVAAGGAAAAAIGAMSFVARAQTLHWRDSQALWNHALQCTRDNYIAHNNMGRIMLEMGRVEDAVSHYREVVRIKPEDADARGNLGNALLQNGGNDEAITQLLRAVELAPHSSMALFNLGNGFLQTGHVEDAIRSYEKAIEANPGFEPAQNNLGTIFYQMGRFDEAISHLIRVVEISPGSASAHGNLGLVLLKSGKIDEAVRHYEAAIQLNPAEAGALSNLAWVLATCPDAARRDGTRALALAKKAAGSSLAGPPDILESLAAAQAETGDFNAAVVTAAQAIDLSVRAGNEAKARSIQIERDSYVKGQPWRDASMTTAGPPLQPK